MTNRAMPPVTIGLPIFNGERFVRDSLDSLLAQDFDAFELLISDNASTDATEEICRAYAAGDPRVRYERLTENRGAAANYNRLVHLARGAYFKWAAYDDLCAPNLLRRCYDELTAHPEAVLSYAQTTIIDEHGAAVRDYDEGLHLDGEHACRRLLQLTRRISLCNACFGLIRHDALLKTALIGAYPSSDITLLAQLALLGQFREVPQRLFYRRIHPGSSRQGEQSAADAAVWFDPKRARRVLLPPRYRVMFETAKTVTTSRMGVTRTAGCVVAYLATFFYRRLHINASRLKHRLRRRFSGS